VTGRAAAEIGNWPKQGEQRQASAADNAAEGRQQATG